MHEHAEPETATAATPGRTTEQTPVAARQATTRSSAPESAAAGPGRTRDEGSGSKDGVAGAVVGGLAGAALGAGIGFLAGGPLGALVGGLIGAAGGAIAGGLIGAAGGAGAAARNVVINITKLAGVTDTVDADIGHANVVLSQANLRVSRGNTATLSAADTATILGPDGRLDDFTGSVLTWDEQQLVTHNRTSGRITAYWVPLFSHAAVRGEAITPDDFGVPDPSVVVAASNHVPDTLAHELGHVLTN